MKHCEFCGSESPDNAQYCGNCGRKIDDRYATVTDFDNPLEMGIPERQTPPIFSSPVTPNIQGSGMGWQDTDSTLRTSRSVEDMEHVNPQFIHRNTDENDAVLPDLLLPGMLAMQGQMPSPAQAPMVQGTPQFGGVPSVQGTPAAPGNVPQSIPGPAHGAASSAPYNAPQEAQPNPIHQQQVQHPGYQPHPHHYPPVHQPQPTPPPNELEHKHHHRHHTGPLHEHKPRSSRLHHPAAVTSKAGMSVVSKWIIFTIAALVIIGSSSILLAHALMPTTPPPVLIITGSSAVKDGGILHVHGQGFQPGDGVTLTIDNGLPVSLAGQHGTQAISQGAERNAQVTGLSQMNIVGALQPHSANNSNITVSSTGTFDAAVTVPSGLPAGKHVIHATDNQSSLSASLQFTIPSPQLAVNPTSLNFGSVEVGRTVKLLVTLSTQGGAGLHWTATVGGSNTSWLTLSKSSGVIGADGSSEPIIVTANTNGLSVGPHAATLRFHSANGDAQTTVKINVISVAQSGQQAILNVSQQSLDFGQLQAGQQSQKNISIANLGNLPLQWQASTDAASANWLSLATTKGTVQPGGVPQMVQVNVDTNGLAAGSYSSTIHITSNGGNTQIGVTLVVTGSTQTPTPTVTPTQSSTPTQTPTSTPTQTSTPTSTPTQTPTSTPTIVSPPTSTPTSTPTQAPPPPVLTVAASGNCPPDNNGNFICTDALTISGSQGSIDWNVNAENDLPGTTFNPSNGTMTAGQSPQSVTVTIPGSDCPKYSGGHYDYSWTGSNTARVTFTCLSPTLTPSPTTPSAFGSGTWQDPYGGSSYVGDVVTMKLTVQGNMFTGTLTGTTGDNTTVHGQDGPPSLFSSNDQQLLNFVIQNYSSQTGIFLVFTNDSQFEGAMPNCRYYGVVQQNGNIQGFWYFPTGNQDVGSIHMNKLS